MCQASLWEGIQDAYIHIHIYIYIFCCCLVATAEQIHRGHSLKFGLRNLFLLCLVCVTERYESAPGLGCMYIYICINIDVYSKYYFSRLHTSLQGWRRAQIEKPCRTTNKNPTGNVMENASHSCKRTYREWRGVPHGSHKEGWGMGSISKWHMKDEGRGLSIATCGCHKGKNIPRKSIQIVFVDLRLPQP